MSKLPPVLSELLSRTLFASFRLNPRPASLGDSMAIFQQIGKCVAPHGKIIYYRQSMCPVTKERLEKLQLLVEDFNAKKERVDVVSKAEPLTEFSALERSLAGLNGRMYLEFATRDPEQILALKYVKTHNF